MINFILGTLVLLGIGLLSHAGSDGTGRSVSMSLSTSTLPSASTSPSVYLSQTKGDTDE
jgi:hypothetical protein